MQDVLEVDIRVSKKNLSPKSASVIRKIESFDWILFTSKNAVIFFVKELTNRTLSISPKTRIGAVGKETALALQQAGLPVHLVPKKHTVKNLIKSLGNISSQKILYPRSTIAPFESVQMLRSRGAIVHGLPLYETHAKKVSILTKKNLLEGNYVSLVLKSPSGVKGFLKQLSPSEKQAALLLPVLCMGPTTAQASRIAGFKKVSLKGT